MKVRSYSALLTTILFLTLSLCFNATLAQTSGDYRTKATGLWSSIANWEVYDGSSWQNASAIPDGNAGLITISAADSINLSFTTSLDQLVVNGKLTIFHGSTAIAVTLDNTGATPDLMVNGTLTISANANLTGTGRIETTPSSFLVVRNSGRVSVPAITNAGITIFNTTAYLDNCAFVNNNEVNWGSGNLNLGNSSVTNNGIFYFSGASNAFLNGTGTNSFVNSLSGSIYRTTSTGTLTINTAVPFSNQGLITGSGIFLANSTVANSGSISPGMPTGLLRVSAALLTGKSAKLNLAITTTGAVAGSDYDQLILAVSANISSVSLEVKDLATDPIGTVYTILSGPYTGTFATLNLANTLGNLTYAANAITVEKVGSVLPLKWGNISVTAGEKNQANVTWTTLDELNVKKFHVEYATEGNDFKVLEVVASRGNGKSTTVYNFLHTNLPTGSYHRYRIRQFDIDGKSSYSAERLLRMEVTKQYSISIFPNPVVNQVQISVNGDQLELRIFDTQGKLVKQSKLRSGTNMYDLSGLLKGSYFIQLISNNAVVGVQKIIKQ